MEAGCGVQHTVAQRARRIIESLRAFRQAHIGCFDAWMTGGLEGKNDWRDWKDKKSLDDWMTGGLEEKSDWRDVK